VRRVLVTASVVPSSPIAVALMKEAIRSSETSVLTTATQRNIPEDTILQMLMHMASVLNVCLPKCYFVNVSSTVPRYRLELLPASSG
jgi:hypothetical protein